MNMNASKIGSETVVALSGRFTFSDHPAFREMLTNHVELMASGSRITFDLSTVEFVDSAALGMLLLAREAAQRRSGTITIRGANGQVRRMLDVSRFEMLFNVET